LILRWVLELGKGFWGGLLRQSLRVLETVV